MPCTMPSDLGLIQTQHDSFQRHEELIKLIQDADVFYVPVRGEFGEGPINNINEIKRRFDEDLINKKMTVTFRDVGFSLQLGSVEGRIDQNDHTKVSIFGKNIVDGICIQFIGYFDSQITENVNQTGYEKDLNMMNVQRICGIGRVELDEQMYLKLSSTQTLPTSTDAIDSEDMHSEEISAKLIDVTTDSKDYKNKSSHVKNNLLGDDFPSRSMASTRKKTRSRTISESVLTSGTSPTTTSFDHSRLHSSNTGGHPPYPSPSTTTIRSSRVIRNLKTQTHRTPSPVPFGYSPSSSSAMHFNVLNSPQQSVLMPPVSQTQTTISSSSPSNTFNDYNIASTSSSSNRYIGDSASISSMSPSLSTTSVSPIESQRRVHSPPSSAHLHNHSIINHTTAPIQITTTSSPMTLTNHMGSYTTSYIVSPIQSPVGSHSLPAFYNFGVLPHANTNIAYITPARFDFALGAATAANPGGMLFIAAPNVQLANLTPTTAFSEQQFQTHVIIQQQQQQQAKIQFASLQSSYASSFMPANVYSYNSVQVAEQTSPTILQTRNILSRMDESQGSISTTTLQLNKEELKLEETTMDTTSFGKIRNKSFVSSSVVDKQYHSLSKPISVDEQPSVVTTLPFKKRRVLNCVDEQEDDEYEDTEGDETEGKSNQNKKYLPLFA